MTKTNTRSRIVSILLVLMMLLTMVPITGVTASAAEPEWTTVNSYAELQTAVKAKKEYIKLGRDIDTKDFHYSGGGLDLADWLTFEGQTCTLDLNGKTLSLMTKIGNVPTFMRVYDGSNLTIKDSQGGGQITGEFENTGASDRYLIHMNKSSLTLEGGTFCATAKPYGTNINVIGYIESNVTIKDGVTISQPEHHKLGGALESHGYALCDNNNNYGPETSHVVIDGGTFDGWVRLMGYQDTNDSVQINSGTFKKGVQLLYKAGEGENNSAPVVTVNGGTFEDNVYLNSWAWKTYLNMPYRLNGGTFYGTLDLYAEGPIEDCDKPKESLNVALGLDKCFGYSAIAKHDGVFTGGNIHNAIDWETIHLKYWVKYKMLLKGSTTNPIRIIPNAWGMKSVTLDGNPIDYFKDWKGTVERMDNSTAHTLKFEWYPLAQELKDAGYTYRANFDCYTVGSNTPTTSVPISATATEYSHTIPAGAAPSVYPFDLQLNLDKNGSSVGIMGNQHIVKLVVSEAPVVEPDPTIEGSVYYTSGIVFGRSISTAASVTPAEATKAYQWQRSTNGGSTWTNIDGATRGSYTPVAADMGENVRIRVVVTAEGYLGEIVGAAVKVSKAANDNTPAPPAVAAQKDDSGTYKKFVISDFNSNQEYVYTTSAPTSGNEWPTGGTEIDSSTVTGLTEGSTYYIYTRFKENDTQTAGSKISSSSVLLDDVIKLNRIILTDESGKEYSSYGNGNTIYIKKGESMTLNVTKNPVGANKWSAFTFQSQYGVSGPFTVTAPTGSVASGAEIPSVTIHGDKVGTGTLAAEYSGYSPQFYGTWRVHVYENISDIGTGAEITVSPSFPDMTMYQGETMSLPEYTVSVYPEGALADYHYEWYVREPATSPGSMGSGNNVKENTYFKVNDDGTITAKAVHTGSEDSQYKMVLLYAVKGEYDKTKLASFNVTVTAAPVIELTGVTVAPTKVNLDLNATYQLSAVKEPVNAAGSLIWESSNPGVATVDSTGKVTAKAQGTAIITVSCGDKKDTCTVTVDHQHDYSGQPYLYLDPGNHYQECKVGDGYNIQAHEFTAWTDNGNGTHSRHCTVCKMTDGSTYTETTEHTWVWVVDQEAALGQPGKQHEECTGCHAKRSENTEIPALQDYAVTVTGGTATVAAGTPITRAMEGVEVTVTAQAPDGTHFVKWVVKAGGVTLANETSATTTFIMPANDVTIEAECAENPVESYTLTVIKGTASVAAGTPITDKIEQNTVVTVTANAPETGKVFDKWVVLEGNVTLTDATKATTTFTMPASAVKIEATYKDAPPSHTHSYGTEWKYDDTNHWHECECGDKADTAAHNFQWVIDKAATKEATGIKHEECTVCGAKRSENTVIDKLPDGGNTGNTGTGDNNTNKPGKDDSTKSPQTGDSSNLIGWLAALFVSGGVLTALGLNGKKRKESEAE